MSQPLNITLGKKKKFTLIVLFKYRRKSRDNNSFQKITNKILILFSDTVVFNTLHLDKDDRLNRNKNKIFVEKNQFEKRINYKLGKHLPESLDMTVLFGN